MQRPPLPDLAEVADAFAVDGPIGPIEPLGCGLINDTFSLTAGSGYYVLQRINARVFPDPARIAANLRVLAEHLAGRGVEAGTEGNLRIPAPVPARDGCDLVRDGNGGLWRLMELIPDGVTLSRVETAAQAREIGAALGRFHRLCRDLPTECLARTLPGFHCTPEYLAQLAAVRPRALLDGTAGAERIRDCLGFIDARADLAQVLERARADGRIPERVTHGDPKIDNILFHRRDGHALALIDLDTVQPGLIQHDLGDCLRSCCNRMGESPEGFAEARFDLDLCAAIVDAYAAEMGPFLGAWDRALLFDSIRLMPFELAVRYLADHLDGDRWFRVNHRGQNLHKAEVQIALTEDIEAKEPEIRAILANAFGVPET